MAKHKEVPSLDLGLLKLEHRQFSPIHKDASIEQSEEDLPCSCSDCKREEVLNEDEDPIEFSRISNTKSIPKENLLDEDREKYKSIKELKGIYEMINQFN